MSTVRSNKSSDATWCRDWTCDTTAERTALAATWTSPGGPKRGDTVLDNETGQLYMFTNGGGMFQITGLQTSPVDLNSDVTGILPAGNLPPTFDWQPVAFSAGDFTANASMVWTVGSGDVQVNRLGLSYDGGTAIWNCSIIGGVVSGTPDSYLQIAFPFGLVPNTYFLQPATGGDTTDVFTPCYAWAAAGSQAFIQIGKLISANPSGEWDAGITEVDFTVTYEVEP